MKVKYCPKCAFSITPCRACRGAAQQKKAKGA